MDNNKIWVFLYGVNDYNQYGLYFIRCFKEKPTISDIALALKETENVNLDTLETTSITRLLEISAILDNILQGKEAKIGYHFYQLHEEILY